jgi:muconate cycloisomerase
MHYAAPPPPFLRPVSVTITFMQRRCFLGSALLGGVPAGGSPGEKESLIRKVEAIPAKVPYRDTFVIGRGLVAAAGQAGQYVFVRIETADGRVGWGETIALPSWSYETVESITTTVRNHLAGILIGRSPFDQAYFQRRFDDVLTPAVSQGFPFAKSAVIVATLDLAAQVAGVPLHRLFGGKLRDKLDLAFALSIDTPRAMAEAARAYPSAKCFKLKVSGDPGIDGERVRAVVEARPEVDLWIDANQTYRPMHLESFLKAIDGIRQVRCLEQPVKSVDWFGMKRARDHTSLPIAVDEGCFSAYDVARLARMEACDLVVLKVAKSGGPLGCQRSAVVAEANGLGLLGSGLTESGIGLTATVHLFSTFDLLLPPELNGPKFIKNLMVDGLRIEGTSVTVPDAPGLGVVVDEKALRAAAAG